VKFTCRFENKATGELRDLISTLDPNEIAEVERVRHADGDESALVTAGCIVLKSAYSELDAFEWNHLSAPAPLN
jgi:hypothetical protein